MSENSTSNNVLDDYLEKNPAVEPADLYKAFPLIGFDLWSDAGMLPKEMYQYVKYDETTFKEGGSQAVYTALTDAIHEYVAGKTCSDLDETKPHFSILLHFAHYNTSVDYDVTDEDPAYVRTFSVWAPTRFLDAFDAFVQQ